MEALYEHAGGSAAIRRFVDTFYSSVLADPLLRPLFGEGSPTHVDHLAAFDSAIAAGSNAVVAVELGVMSTLTMSPSASRTCGLGTPWQRRRCD
jgi:hypothetical protein